MDDRVGTRIIAPREHVDGVSGATELARDVRDVDVLAAAVDAAGRGDRRGVLADECDLHGTRPWAAGPRLRRSGASAVPCCKTSGDAARTPPPRGVHAHGDTFRDADN
jgi:hypothetical protein